MGLHPGAVTLHGSLNPAHQAGRGAGEKPARTSSFFIPRRGEIRGKHHGLPEDERGLQITPKSFAGAAPAGKPLLCAHRYSGLFPPHEEQIVCFSASSDPL